MFCHSSCIPQSCSVDALISMIVFFLRELSPLIYILYSLCMLNCLNISFPALFILPLFQTYLSNHLLEFFYWPVLRAYQTQSAHIEHIILSQVAFSLSAVIFHVSIETVGLQVLNILNIHPSNTYPISLKILNNIFSIFLQCIHHFLSILPELSLFPDSFLNFYNKAFHWFLCICPSQIFSPQSFQNDSFRFLKICFNIY